jgi:hypothetical protein
MTCRAFAASSGRVSMCSASVSNAFHSAQPRPRDQVASSSGRAVRNAFRLSPENSVHAIVTSHAGSPTAEQPKSMTALN